MCFVWEGGGGLGAQVGPLLTKGPDRRGLLKEKKLHIFKKVTKFRIFLSKAQPQQFHFDDVFLLF